MKEPANVYGGLLQQGKYNAWGNNTTVICSNHNYNLPALSGEINQRFKIPNVHVGKPPEIGNDCWIGHGTIILPGVTIGDGAVIGAGSVVSRDVEAYAVVAGNPVELITWRARGVMRDFLLELRWWDWSEARINRNAAFFSANINGLTVPQLRELVVD